MTLPRVMELMGQWYRSPPQHWLLASLAGFTPPAKVEKGKKTEGQDLSALANFPGMSSG